MARSLLFTEAALEWGEQQQRCLAEAEELRRRGYEITIAAPREAQLFQHAAQANFPLFEIPTHPMALPRALFALCRYIKKHKIDLLHAHSPLDSYLAAMAARLTIRKSIRTLHIGKEKQENLLPNRLTSGIIPTSPAALAQMEAPEKALCSSLPMGIDASKISPSEQKRKTFRQKLGLTEKQFVVGACSTQNITILFEAARLLRAHQRLRWIVAEEGTQHEPLLKRIGLQGRVLFTGKLSEPAQAMHAADVALFLSTQHHELNTLALEVACEGVPLITTRVSGLLEVCVEYQTGYTIEVCEPTAIADHVLRLMDDRRSCQRLGKAARERVLRKFTRERTFEQLEALYAKL